MIVLFLIYRAFHSETDDARFFIFDGIWQGEINAEASGAVDYLELRQGNDTVSTSIYLKDVIIILEGKEYSLDKLLVYQDGRCFWNLVIQFR